MSASSGLVDVHFKLAGSTNFTEMQMSWWRNLFGRGQPTHEYGLHLDNPVLCGGGVDGEIDYLQRLRCPSGMPIRFQRRGSIERNSVEYLKDAEVNLAVSRGMRRRMGDDPDPRQIPVDVYLVVCECGTHQGQLFLDMYFRGPELPIGNSGWTLTEGDVLAEETDATADCPYCGKELRTPKAKQCRFCKMDWHDPENVFRREPRGT